MLRCFLPMFLDIFWVGYLLSCLGVNVRGGEEHILCTFTYGFYDMIHLCVRFVLVFLGEYVFIYLLSLYF